MNNEEAVSPVIAVILMVAITVVLAATVFVLVSDIGGDQNIAPAFNLSQDETADRLTVQSADPKANWNRLEIQASASSLRGIVFNLGDDANGPGETGGNPLANNATAGFQAVTTTSNPMGASEFLDFCASGAAATPSGTVTDVTITIRDVQANSKVGDWVFQSIASCAAGGDA